MFVNGNRVRVNTNEFEFTGINVGDEGVVHVDDGYVVWVDLADNLVFPFFGEELELVSY